MVHDRPDNLNDPHITDTTNCSVCKDLFAHIGRFLDMLETTRRSFSSDWLTVDEIAKEFKNFKKRCIPFNPKR